MISTEKENNIASENISEVHPLFNEASPIFQMSVHLQLNLSNDYTFGFRIYSFSSTLNLKNSTLKTLFLKIKNEINLWKYLYTSC